MSELTRFKEVNNCETLEDLANVIENFSDEDGFIQGRKQKFIASNMADVCRRYTKYEHNILTREFGIRQQALYILFYKGDIN